MAAEVQQIDAGEVYRSIGRLEGAVSHLVARLDRIERHFRPAHIRVVRILRDHGAALAAIMAKLFLGS